MTKNSAIVLRGPPCAGKTTVKDVLLRRLPSRHFVSLDDGWADGESRAQDDDPYADLRVDAQVLIIELGFGEPVAQRFAGATRNPAKWLGVLSEENRSTYLFLLKPPLAEVLRRIAVDRSIAMHAYYRTAAHRYESGGVCSPTAFGARLGEGFTETYIDTSSESAVQSADRILKVVGR
jgi:hypothetical protein